jgi:hypothetical protein
MAVALVLVTSPVWVFELLFHIFLPANRPQLPARTDATQLEMDALWLETGESSTTSQDVTPLWALNYFNLYKTGADPRSGVHAASQVARVWAAQAWPPDVRVRHLRRTVTEVAVLVWLSRTATAEALKRALAEETFFGRHSYGIKAATKAYYGCSASDLTTAQVALLVGLPQSPTRFDPVAHPNLAAKRRQEILKSLADAGVISGDEAAKAAAENAESAVVPNTAPCQ